MASYRQNQLAILLSSGEYDTDKAIEYIRVYDELFWDKRDEIKSILEIGVLRGGSLRLWHDYFPTAKICGLDNQDILPNLLRERIQQFRLDQTDVAPLKYFFSGMTFDVIIDDGCHLGSAIKTSMEALWPMVKPGGYYIIEDWGVGYWKNWTDSPVPLMKELVDGVGAAAEIRQVSFYSGRAEGNWKDEWRGGGHLAVIQKREM